MVVVVSYNKLCDSEISLVKLVLVGVIGVVKHQVVGISWIAFDPILLSHVVFLVCPIWVTLIQFNLFYPI